MRSITSLFVLTFLVLLTHSANAQCSQWDLTGQWSIQQEETRVNFDVHQTGTVITGRAQYIFQKKATTTPIFGAQLGKDAVSRSGDVDGTLNGDVFSVHIYWDGNHTIGIYNGRISPSGKMEGDV